MVFSRRWCLLSVSLAGISIASSATPLAGGFAASSLTLSHAPAVGFESGPGSMAVSDVVFDAPLACPVFLHDTLWMMPSIGIRSSILTFESIPTSVIDTTSRDLTVFPMVFRLSDSILYQPDGSRWTHGLLATGKLASDLREITSEDFGAEFGIFSGFQIHNRMSIGATFGASLSDHENQFRPGICLDWRIHDDLSLQIAGANWSLQYAANDNRSISLRGFSTNEIWNMFNAADETLTLKLGSYRIGCFLDQQLTDTISLSLGAGITLNNRIKLDDMYGESVVNAHMDDGPFVELGIKVLAW